MKVEKHTLKGNSDLPLFGDIGDSSSEEEENQSKSRRRLSWKDAGNRVGKQTLSAKKFEQSTQQDAKPKPSPKSTKTIRKCVTSDELNKDQHRLNKFLSRFSKDYKYFCPKNSESIKPDTLLHDFDGVSNNFIQGSSFIDIRPKKHILPAKFREHLTDMARYSDTGNRFYSNIASLYSDDVIYSLFTGISTGLFGSNT